MVLKIKIWKAGVFLNVQENLLSFIDMDSNPMLSLLNRISSCVIQAYKTTEDKLWWSKRRCINNSSLPVIPNLPVTWQGVQTSCFQTPPPWIKLWSSTHCHVQIAHFPMLQNFVPKTEHFYTLSENKPQRAAVLLYQCCVTRCASEGAEGHRGQKGKAASEKTCTQDTSIYPWCPKALCLGISSFCGPHWLPPPPVWGSPLSNK